MQRLGGEGKGPLYITLVLITLHEAWYNSVSLCLGKLKFIGINRSINRKRWWSLAAFFCVIIPKLGFDPVTFHMQSKRSTI